MGIEVYVVEGSDIISIEKQIVTAFIVDTYNACGLRHQVGCQAI